MSIYSFTVATCERKKTCYPLQHLTRRSMLNWNLHLSSARHATNKKNPKNKIAKPKSQRERKILSSAAPHTQTHTHKLTCTLTHTRTHKHAYTYTHTPRTHTEGQKGSKKKNSLHSSAAPHWEGGLCMKKRKRNLYLSSVDLYIHIYIYMYMCIYVYTCMYL